MKTGQNKSVVFNDFGSLLSRGCCGFRRLHFEFSDWAKNEGDVDE